MLAQFLMRRRPSELMYDSDGDEHQDDDEYAEDVPDVGHAPFDHEHGSPASFSGLVDNELTSIDTSMGLRC